jgi:hypothetical protein
LLRGFSFFGIVIGMRAAAAVGFDLSLDVGHELFAAAFHESHQAHDSDVASGEQQKYVASRKPTHDDWSPRVPANDYKMTASSAQLAGN